MKKTLAILILLASLAHLSAQDQPNLGLIPTPQQVTLDEGGKTCVLARAKVKEVMTEFGRGEGQPQNLSQAYRLVIEPRRITIHYKSPAGREYALMTLAQLRLLHDTLPCCTITDWPAYALRGWMDDQSRGPVPHDAYRQRQWQVLHALKYNFCNYYTEHTLYQAEFPDLAPAYADSPRHPDEVINLQLFAHAEKTLRIPYYEHLMDGRANFNPDTEATYDFLRRRIAEAYRQLPQSPFFIIDCDETEQLGTGRARRLVEEKGVDQVYVDHINRCYRLVKDEAAANPLIANRQSPRVVMWGDIVAKNPDMMRQLPRDMTYIMWAYEPLDSYDHLIRPFRENGTPFWVAPSLSHSSNMLPNPARYMKNIANLARDGYRAGAEGLMNTCWDDNGEALFDNCWHGLFWSAEMAWNPIRTDDPEEFRRREAQFNENFERLFYGSTTEPGLSSGASSAHSHVSVSSRNVDALYAVGALESDPTVADWYTSAALLEPLLNFNPDNTAPAMAKRVEHVSHLIDRFQVDSAANPHACYALDRIAATAMKAHVRLAIAAALEDTLMYADCRGYAEDYLQQLFDLKREYLRLWDQENGEYERQIVCDRYDRLAREVLDLDRHVFVSIAPQNQTNQINQTNQTNQKIQINQKNQTLPASPLPLVTLRTLFGDRPIFYTLDGSDPDSSSARYTAPFPLERSATIRAIAYNEYGEGVISQQYLLSHKAMGATLTLRSPYSTYRAIYSGGGPQALIDGQLGSNATYADGHWQGYWGDSIDAVIDFGQPTDVSEVSMRFMQNTFDWLLAPTEISVYASSDSASWHLVGHASFPLDPRQTGMRLKRCLVPLGAPGSVRTRFLRVVVPNRVPLPAWHPAPGQPAYLFTDEIVVN